MAEENEERTDSQNAEESSSADENKKKGGALGLVAGAVLVLGSSVAVGILAFPSAPHGQEAAEHEEAAEEELPDTTVLLDVPQMLVNLADSNGIRLLQVRMSLELACKDAGKTQTRFNEILPKVQDRIIKLLSSLTNQDIDGGTNKEFVQTRIKDVLNLGVLRDEDFKVADVYFTEFVVQ